MTKASRPGGEASGARRAEMPVRGPQYESQHRAMEQEYSYGPANQGGPSTSPPGRASSAPPSSMTGSSGYQYTNHRMSPPPMVQGRSGSPPGHPAMQQGRSGSPPGHHPMQQGRSGSPPGHHIMQQGMPQQVGQYYYNHGIESHGHNQIPHPSMSYSLPPGAMVPLPMDQSWFASTGSGHSISPPTSPLEPQSYNYTPHSMPSGQQQQHAQAAPRRQRSPPPNHLTNPGHPKHPTVMPPGGRLQGRSLSATAVSSPSHLPTSPNGRLKKKHPSVAATPVRRRSSDGGGSFGDEDLPLAVWQQQQRASGRR